MNILNNKSKGFTIAEAIVALTLVTTTSYFMASYISDSKTYSQRSIALNNIRQLNYNLLEIFKFSSNLQQFENATRDIYEKDIDEGKFTINGGIYKYKDLIYTYNLYVNYNEFLHTSSYLAYCYGKNGKIEFNNSFSLKDGERIREEEQINEENNNEGNNNENQG